MPRRKDPCPEQGFWLDFMKGSYLMAVLFYFKKLTKLTDGGNFESTIKEVIMTVVLLIASVLMILFFLFRKRLPSMFKSKEQKQEEFKQLLLKAAKKVEWGKNWPNVRLFHGFITEQPKHLFVSHAGLRSKVRIRFKLSRGQADQMVKVYRKKIWPLIQGHVKKR